VDVVSAGSPPEYSGGLLSFRISLAPHETWHACILWCPFVDRCWQRPVSPCHDLVGEGSEAFRGLRAWRRTVTDFRIPETGEAAVVDRALADLCGLRLHRYNIEAAGDEGDHDDSSASAWVPAGGVPWYVSLFGRDALVCALQTIALSPRFAVAALEALARTQADRYDDSRDMQPGKIQHEWRHGELAHFDRIPQTPYYGDHGATTLFVWTAGEVWKWLGDRRLLARLRSPVERALAWIDRDADLDGDGFQEYRTRAGGVGRLQPGLEGRR
jgi:glycogen debranching enzyme